MTKTGKVLTDADVEALADEAERGYCVMPKVDDPNALCGHVVPCPDHPLPTP